MVEINAKKAKNGMEHWNEDKYSWQHFFFLTSFTFIDHCKYRCIAKGIVECIQ